MADETLMQSMRGAGELRTYLEDPLEKDFLTMEMGGYLPQLNLASAVGMRHISPPLADLADALTDPISAALFGLGGKLFKAGVKGGSAALRAGVRGSIKAATSAEKVALAMADKLAIRAGKALETQTWETIRPVVEAGIQEGKSAEAIIGDLTKIKRDLPRWKTGTRGPIGGEVTQPGGHMLTPSSRQIDHIIGAIHGEKPSLAGKLIGRKAVAGSPEEALAFIDEQIALRKTLHADVIKAGQAGDVPGFLSALDEAYKIEPSARQKILRAGAKKQMALAEKGLERVPGAEFARMHPSIATFTPFKKAGMVPGGEAGAEAVARAQKWPIQTQGFETVITGFAKIGQAVKGAVPPQEGAAATDIAKVHIGDVQWGDVSTSIVMRDFAQKFDLPARSRIGRMIMDPEAAFEGVTKEIDILPETAGLPARETIRYKTLEGARIGSLNGLTPKPGFGTNEAEVLVADQIKATLEDTGKYLVEEDVIKGMLDNYFPRVIRNYGKVLKNQKALSALEELKQAISKETTPGATGKLSGFTRHGLPRTLAYDELLKLEEKGLLQVEKDPARILSEYFRSVNKAAADKRAISRLAHNAYPVVPSGAEGPKVGPLIYTRGEPPPKSIAHLYELGDDPSLLSVAREMYGAGVSGKVWVLKEAHAPIRRAFGAGLYQGPAKSITEAGLRAALVMNSFAKRSSMFMSMFHLLNLTESMVMDMGASFFNPRAFARATKSLYNASDVMEFAVRSGMTVGPIVDAEWNTFTKAITGATDWLKSKRLPIGLQQAKQGLEGVLRGWNWVDGQWNRFMWDYYQNSAKMMAFSEMYYDALRRFPNMKPNEIGESVARHVNNAIGGINWERFWISKQGQQWARLIVFAPDYTMTNLMLAADVFAAKFVKAPGQRIPFKVLFEDSPQAYYARQFAFRARTIPALLANHLNYAMSAWRDGQGHWLDQNDEGNQDRIEMPWLDEKGEKQYYRFGKQMKEPVELVRMWDQYDGPWKFMRKKMGNIPQFFVTNFSGTDAVGQPIITVKDGWVQKLGEELGFTQGQTRWIQEISDRTKLGIEMGIVPIQLRQAGEFLENPVSSTVLTVLGAPIYGGRKPRKEPRPTNQQAMFGGF